MVSPAPRFLVNMFPYAWKGEEGLTIDRVHEHSGVAVENIRDSLDLI